MKSLFCSPILLGGCFSISVWLLTLVTAEAGISIGTRPVPPVEAAHSSSPSPLPPSGPDLAKLKTVENGVPIILCIGNDAYEHGTKLKNAASDASAIASLLVSSENLSSIKNTTNLTAAEMRKKLAGWAKTTIPQSETKDTKSHPLAFFYYSGHGAELFDKNQLTLTGIDVDPNNEGKIDDGGLSLEEVLASAQKLADQGCGGVIFIDATVPSGVPLPAPPSGWICVFSGLPGKEVLDGTDRSPFTQALLNCLRGAALSSSDGRTADLKMVIEAVCQQTFTLSEDRQQPWFIANQFTGSVRIDPETEILSPER